MQRFSFAILFLASLYVSAGANATQDPLAASSVQAVAATPQELPVPVADNPAPHIALLLPLKSPAFAHVAEMVQQGFLAAAGVQQGLPVRVYASSDESKDVIAHYRQAIANGALAVAGPLTRNGVTALANYAGIAVPTLALNAAESSSDANKLYFFGLSAENEAHQIAQTASAAELHNATIITTGTVFSKRLAAAFAEEWKKQGGTVTAEVQFAGDFSVLTNLPVAPWPEGTEPKPVSDASDTGGPASPSRPLPPSIAPGNMVFLAAEHGKARLIRPYLNPTLPVYATSSLFVGNTNKLANFDLNEVRFADMPWLLQPDHPAVMIYPRAATALDPETDRFYALGIDAYRLVYILLTNNANSALPLDGVTGKISLNRQQFLREPIPAFFRQGLGLTAETLSALNAAKAEAKAAAKQAESERVPSPPAR